MNPEINYASVPIVAQLRQLSTSCCYYFFFLQSHFSSA